jgi:type IV pilus assembly protein PilY1
MPSTPAATCGDYDDSATTSSWVTTKIAALAGSALGDKRKFIFAPDIVFGSDGSPYDAILVGSGDREHPFDATVTNRFYMLKDRNTGISVTSHTTIVDTTFNATTAPSGVFDATNNCLQDRDVCPDGSSNLTGAQASIVSAPGWKLTLGTGEKNVGTATTLAGTVFFNTNQPSGSAGGGSCGSNLGIARQYQVGFADATATQNLNSVDGLQTADRSTIVEGGGFLPSPVPLIVEIDGQKYQAVISGVQVQTPPGLQLESRVRSYWYRRIE